MKRRVLFLILVVSAVLVPMRMFAITIQNGEDAVYYYLVRGGTNADLQAMKDTPQAIVQYILSHQADLAYVPPLGVRPDVGVGNGPAAIVGFFARPGEVNYAVSAIFVSPSDTNSPFTVGQSSIVHAGDGTGQEVTIRSLDLDPASEPILIDNRYLDWLKVPTFARYANYFVPRRFVQERDGVRKELPIQNSLFWKKGGTQIEYFKAIRSNRYLYLLLSSASELSSGLSYLFYLYQDRNSGPGKYTIEIPVDRKSGLVVLWSHGEKQPAVIGDFVHSTFFLEARIRLDRLPAIFSDPGLSMDLASAMHDAGLYEEFYFSTLFARDIPR